MACESGVNGESPLSSESPLGSRKPVLLYNRGGQFMLCNEHFSFQLQPAAIFEKIEHDR